MNKRITQSKTPFVSISDLIEELEIVGTEYSIAICPYGHSLIIADPNTFRVIATVHLTESGTYLEPEGIQ